MSTEVEKSRLPEQNASESSTKGSRKVTEEAKAFLKKLHEKRKSQKPSTPSPERALAHLGASGRLPNLLPEVLNDEADRP
jgi:hypothetical protein